MVLMGRPIQFLVFSLVGLLALGLRYPYNNISPAHSHGQKISVLKNFGSVEKGSREFSNEYNKESLKSKRLQGGSKSRKILPQGKPRGDSISNPNRLRIIAGTARGKKLLSPDVYLRPMMGKVREAVFSTLQHIEFFSRAESRVLDIFCGSGSVGLEALSRGAQHVTFVDLSQNCINTALGNAQSCGFSGKVEGVEARAESFLLSPDSYVSPKPYDLISLTPPYEEVSYDQLIDSLCSSNLMNENTILLIEYPVEMGSMPYILGQDKFFGLRNRRYGRTIVAMYVYRPSTKVDMRPEEFSLAQNNLD